MLKNLKYKLILASGSPRRQQFFKELGLDFEIRLREVEEVYPADLKGAQITNFLAKLKASAFTDLADGELLVTSDTIVWLNDNALGKPKNYDDAVSMLKALSGKTHEVITSVCFKTLNSIDLIDEITKVTFANFEESQIRYYLDLCKPFDKAGAYGIQDWIGLIGIVRIEGSYTNVVGLPTQRVFEHLQKYS